MWWQLEAHAVIDLEVDDEDGRVEFSQVERSSPEEPTAKLTTEEEQRLSVQPSWTLPGTRSPGGVIDLDDGSDDLGAFAPAGVVQVCTSPACPGIGVQKTHKAPRPPPMPPPPHLLRPKVMPPAKAMPHRPPRPPGPFIPPGPIRPPGPSPSHPHFVQQSTGAASSTASFHVRPPLPKVRPRALASTLPQGPLNAASSSSRGTGGAVIPPASLLKQSKSTRALMRRSQLGRGAARPKKLVQKAAASALASSGGGGAKRKAAATDARDGPPGHISSQFRTGLVEAFMQRLRFRAVLVRMGRVRGGRGAQQTVLLRNVEAVGSADKKLGHLNAFTDHVWMKVGKIIKAGALRSGDHVEFDARVRWYRKAAGYDLKLSHPTKLKNITGESRQTKWPPQSGQWRR